jgi:hypothetical protein
MQGKLTQKDMIIHTAPKADAMEMTRIIQLRIWIFDSEPIAASDLGILDSKREDESQSVDETYQFIIHHNSESDNRYIVKPPCLRPVGPPRASKIFLLPCIKIRSS